MKKYRQTKITVKTRETISFFKTAANETANDLPNSICPLCHSQLLAAAPPLGVEKAEHDCTTEEIAEKQNKN